MSKASYTKDDDIKEARRLGQELRNKLPNQLVVKSKIMVDGKPMFRDVILKADPEIPGRFTGRVDLTPPSEKSPNGDLK